MSKSLKRVLAEMEALGLSPEIVHKPDGTLTAQDAANGLGCTVGQIVKSILFRVTGQDEHVLFLTSGDNQVDPGRAAALAGCSLERADAASIRLWTGFAIGGVSPFGHINPVRKFLDEDLLQYDVVWAAAGTPNHNFAIDPNALRDVAGAKVADFKA
ncbi:MAG: YbaK/EbsC family protein [Paracoccaceae bacterium]